jgi:branched-subunit amino acid transport protein
MSWWAILGLAAGVYTTKVVGPLVLAGRTLPARIDALLAIVAAPMLAALILVNTVTDGRDYVVDARLPAVAVAIVLAWRRAPFLVVVVAAGATCALIRAAT